MHTVPLRQVPLPVIDPEDRMRLSPFILIFDGVLVPKARSTGFRKASPRALARLSRDLETAITSDLGHRLESVIVMFALRRCGQMYAAAIDQTEPVSVQRAQFHLIDCAWRLIVELEQYLRIDELLILARSL
jgi:hypothetical protein